MEHPVFEKILNLPFKSNLLITHWNCTKELCFGISLSSVQSISNNTITICQIKLTAVPAVLIGPLCRPSLAWILSKPRCSPYIKCVQFIVHKLWDMKCNAFFSFFLLVNLFLAFKHLWLQAGEFNLSHSSGCLYLGWVWLVNQNTILTQLLLWVPLKVGFSY